MNNYTFKVNTQGNKYSRKSTVDVGLETESTQTEEIDFQDHTERSWIVESNNIEVYFHNYGQTDEHILIDLVKDGVLIQRKSVPPNEKMAFSVDIQT